MTFPIIYSRTKRGQVQQWQIEVQGNGYRTTEGLQNGALTTTEWTYCKGKNPGKANVTTDEEQAVKEAAAKHKKKLDSGYCENIADIDKAKFFEPMLAHKWSDYGEDVEYPVYSQPKLDGMRCIVTKDGMFSRLGKPIASAPHIYAALSPIFRRNPDFVFDGELYSHKLKRDFNKLISLAKKTKPTPADLEESAQKLEYWMYDMYDQNNPDANFEQRITKIQELLNQVGSERLKSVETLCAEDKETLDSFYEEYLEEGFEGGMVRTNSKYENCRTKALLKRKEFFDAEYELVDIEEGNGNRAGLATVAFFAHAGGTEVRDGKNCFKTGIIGDEEYAADLLKNKDKVLGKLATIIYQNLTPETNVPRFGKMKVIRTYE